jgi:hypothetical protein
MHTLIGKKILFFAPRFFGYELDILNELTLLGALVDFLPDRPFETPLMTAITKVCPGIIIPLAERIYERFLNEFGATNYDFILVVNGQTLSSSFLNRLRASFPSAQLILYLWDSVNNRPGILSNLRYFDKIYSFDPQDSSMYGICMRPLFFARHISPHPRTHSTHQYHISFVGTVHTDRYIVIDSFRRSLDPSLRTYWYLYLQAPWVYYYYRFIRPSMKHSSAHEFSFHPLPKKQLQSVFSNSLCILDIEHPSQRGLTIRTLETLGASKKLVTTNATVSQYDFYHPSNISIIDRKHPVIPSDFLETPYVPLPRSIYERYSITGWIHHILDIHY